MPKLRNLRLYEAMFLVDTGDAAAWDDLVKHLEDVLTRHGAEVIGITRWDERKLAYLVNKHKRGTYVLSFFAARDGSGIAEIERDCRLSDKVLRVLILRADHFTVADMRLQLGEDLREEVAAKVREARGETEDGEAEVGEVEVGEAEAEEPPAGDASAPAEASAGPSGAPGAGTADAAPAEPGA